MPFNCITFHAETTAREQQKAQKKNKTFKWDCGSLISNVIEMYFPFKMRLLRLSHWRQAIVQKKENLPSIPFYPFHTNAP